MTREQKLKKAWEMVTSHQFEEAFAFGYENDILVCEDWVEIDGIEYYTISVEDDVYMVATDEL